MSEHVIAEHQELHESDIRVLTHRLHSHRSSMWMYIADEAGTSADWKVNGVGFLIGTNLKSGRALQIVVCEVTKTLELGKTFGGSLV